MSKLYLTGQSALQLMRTDAFPRPYEDMLLSTNDLDDAAAHARQIKEIERAFSPLLVTPPYCILVPDKRSRRSSKNAICRVLPEGLATPSFVSIDDACACTTPELTYLYICQRDELVDHVRCAMELCGTYALGPSEHDRITRYNLAPLSTKANIREYAQANHGIRGSGKALSALRYVCDKSASPMETALCMLLCLPPTSGGYGLPLPELNAELPVIKRLGSKRVEGVRYGDLVYRSARLIIEYQSRLFHEYAGNSDEDEERRDDLEMMGHHVMFVTPSRLKNFERFEGIVQRIAHHLGISLNSKMMGPTHERLELRKKLLETELVY